MKTNLSRRHILKLGAVLLLLPLFRKTGLAFGVSKKVDKIPAREISSTRNLGVDKDGYSHIYMAQGKSPEENMHVLLATMGGIEKIIGPNDIVILKPNAQWWNQGTTNTNAMKAFIEAILRRPYFQGEVIIAENHQYDDANSRGWTTTKRNGDFNLNELVEYFQKRGHGNVTKYHWRPVTPQPRSTTDLKHFSKIVEGPWQGDGYVYDRKLVYTSPLGRKAILSYPIFTSSYSGTVIDFKNGAWKSGKYTGQPVKFINFSGINHHSNYCGVTASIKNYMGVVDMSCGAPRGGPDGYFNVHHIGVRNLPAYYERFMPWRIRHKLFSSIEDSYKHRYFHHAGGCLGAFMQKVRKADLNIITAHWVGYGSRTEISLSGHPKALAASSDPVALDSWMAREILSPLTSTYHDREKFAPLNNPDNLDGPFYRFLHECVQAGIGTLDSSHIKVHSSV